MKNIKLLMAAAIVVAVFGLVFTGCSGKGGNARAVLSKGGTLTITDLESFEGWDARARTNLTEPGLYGWKEMPEGKNLENVEMSPIEDGKVVLRMLTVSADEKGGYVIKEFSGDVRCEVVLDLEGPSSAWGRSRTYHFGNDIDFVKGSATVSFKEITTWKTTFNTWGKPWQ